MVIMFVFDDGFNVIDDWFDDVNVSLVAVCVTDVVKVDFISSRVCLFCWSTW